VAETSASLLQRLRERADATAWQRLMDLYTPLIRGWLRRHNVMPVDSDDLVQEVLAVVVRRFPDFEHNRRTGAFRSWLKAITINCMRDFWRAKRVRPVAAGGPDVPDLLAQLEDPGSQLSQLWDREHDLHVTRRLLELIRPQFSAQTWTAFQRVALDGEAADVVAADLGITVNAVFIAKSRVLARLRQEAEGLID
jgi:RNA polymerase sigma-70 factor (ECF subfamily)